MRTHTPAHSAAGSSSGLLHGRRDVGRRLLQVGQGALRHVSRLLVLPVDVLQHLLPMPQLCQVLLDQSIFPLQFVPQLRDILQVKAVKSEQTPEK